MVKYHVWKAENFRQKYIGMFPDAPKFHITKICAGRSTVMLMSRINYSYKIELENVLSWKCNGHIHLLNYFRDRFENDVLEKFRDMHRNSLIAIIWYQIFWVVQAKYFHIISSIAIGKDMKFLLQRQLMQWSDWIMHSDVLTN